MSDAGRESGPIGRKPRILALHGGASNSNLMKFQTGTLRKLLGNGTEWLFPDGPTPWHPASESLDLDIPEQMQWDSSLAEYYADRSSFEMRIAQGKPFAAWFRIISDNGHPVAETSSFERGVNWLMDYVTKNSPIDVLITFSQSSIVANTLTSRLLHAGKDVPWKLSMAFSPTPTPHEQRLEHTMPWPQRAFIITSDLDPYIGTLMEIEAALYSNVTILKHGDGLGFPVKPPVATEIYERLASEIRLCCSLAAPQELSLAQKKSEWAARLAKYRQGSSGTGEAAAPASERAATARWDPRDAVKATSATAAETEAKPEEEEDSGSDDGPLEVAVVTPEELAQLLRDKGCFVVDVEHRRRAFPGVVKEDVSFVTMRMLPEEAAERRLTSLRGDGRRLIAVSSVGDSCPEYCTMLVKRFGFQVEKLSWLSGGARNWDAWELENREASNELRCELGLPLLRGTVVEAVTAEALAELLALRACLVLDVREPDEVRRQAFPGAQKDLSLLTLTKRPHRAKQKLAALSEDGRPVVAVSGTGLRCRRYCALLVDDFGFDADKVCRLEGGLDRWSQWEREHEDACEKIRRVYDLPHSRPRLPEEGRAARERERSLDFLT